jgi:phage gp29-like protein
VSQYITPSRVHRHKQGRFNPLRYLTPERLASTLDEFKAGTLKNAALVFEDIEDKDDTTKAVASKRKATAAGFEWEVVARKGVDEKEAEKHVKALRYCYESLKFTDSLDRMAPGGMSRLFRNIIDAQGKRWALFETVWKPSAAGLTVETIFVPLWFFENRTGDFRFLRDDGEYEGEPLEPGAWMIARGEGLMVANSCCWMFKTIPLQDWLLFCDKHAAPALVAKTDAAAGSDRHTALVELLSDVGVDFSAVIGEGDELTALDLTGGATPGPYKELIERMDKKIITLWMGSDLGTQSSKQGEVGSNAQEKSGQAIDEGDAKLIEETLQHFIDKTVIEWNFGEGTVPLAYIRVIPKQRKDERLEMDKDQFLIDNGAPVSIAAAMERMGRAMPLAGELTFTKPQEATTDATGSKPIGSKSFKKTPVEPETKSSANERKSSDLLASKTVQLVAKAQSDALTPLVDRIQGILELDTEDAQRIAAKRLLGDMPALLKEINANSSGVIDIMEGATIVSILNGMADGVVNRGVNESTKPKVFRIVRGADGEIEAVNVTEGFAYARPNGTGESKTGKWMFDGNPKDL